MNRRSALLLSAVLLVGGSSTAEAQADLGPTVEYIAHAAVIIESASGTRVLIDPYNGDMWMGYRFPEGLDVDAVLVTHPHYDHDAVWYFDASTPVFRTEGEARIGDVRVRGIAGEHAGGARFRARGSEPYNTIWVVEADGVRLAHLGDNRPPTEDDLRAMGSVDVWFTTPFTPASDVRAAAAKAGVRVVIPVHYRLPERAAPTYRLPSAAEWLVDEADVSTHETHRLRLAKTDLPERLAFHVLAAHPSVTSWSADLIEAWEIAEQAGERLAADDPAGAAALFEHAATLAPTVINFHLSLAEAFLSAGRTDEAERALERGLLHAPRSDTERTLRARALLARLYAEQGRDALATAQYRLVLAEAWSYAGAQVEEAQAFLKGR